MPVVLVSTVAESGQTNLGSYSLCFPHIIADEGKMAMMLMCRSTSNTAQNIHRTGVCALNFIPDNEKYLKCAVTLGFPGETTEEKMKNSIFTLIPSMREDKDPDVTYPEIVSEAVQVFECTWDSSYESKQCRDGDNFLLRINTILLKKEYNDAIIRGMDAKHFPRLPIDYGFRDNVGFWLASTKTPYMLSLPKGKEQSIDTVKYTAQRMEPNIAWEDEACAKLVRVPRIFLKAAIAGCIDAAKKEGLTTITPEFMDKIRDKRSQEKKGKA